MKSAAAKIMTGWGWGGMSLTNHTNEVLNPRNHKVLHLGGVNNPELKNLEAYNIQWMDPKLLLMKMEICMYVLNMRKIYVPTVCSLGSLSASHTMVLGDSGLSRVVNGASCSLNLAFSSGQNAC